jgi:hypothetical protein
MAHNRKRSNSTPPKPSNGVSLIGFPPVPGARLSLDRTRDDPAKSSPNLPVSARADEQYADGDKLQPRARRGFRHKVTTKVGELVKAGLSTPPHATHMVAGPSFIYAPDSTLLSFAEIQRHQLAMSGGRHHDIQGIPLPSPFFDPDIYYFAPRSNVGKRPSTAAAAESTTSLANSTSSEYRLFLLFPAVVVSLLSVSFASPRVPYSSSSPVSVLSFCRELFSLILSSLSSYTMLIQAT